ncbi:hypothetical protein VTO73DRAFT_11433 [Trametes versicolor]
MSNIFTKKSTIQIIGGKLGEPCSITLAFMPKDGNLKVDFKTVFPLAWKVIKDLKDGDEFKFDWTNVFAASRAVIDHDDTVKTCEISKAIAVRETTALRVGSDEKYWFTDPIPYPYDRARVMNRTDRKVDIGAGFLVDEAMNTVLVQLGVDRSPANVDYVPTLKIWADLDFAESELLERRVNDVQPIWEGTLTDFDGRIPVIVKRKNGRIIADGPSLSITGNTNSPLLKQLSANFHQSTTYSVDLAFASSALVTEGVRSIVNSLPPMKYIVKTIQKGCGYEARIELTLQETVSCSTAEKDMISAINASPTIYGKAFIKSHSGVTLISANDDMETWLEINPASHHWFNVGSEQDGNTAFNGTNAESFAKANAAEVNGSGANGAAEPVEVKAVMREGSTVPSDEDESVKNSDITAALPDETKFRSIRRNGGGRRALELAA